MKEQTWDFADESVTITSNCVAAMEWVRKLLKVDGMRDDPGPSGITAFALCVGMLVQPAE